MILNRKLFAVFIIGLFLTSIVTVTGVMATENNTVTADSDSQGDFVFTPQAINDATQSDGSIQLIVGLGTQAGALEEVLKIVEQLGGKIVDTINIGDLESIVAAISSDLSSSLAGQLQQSGFTRYVELNVRCYEDAVPSDANYTAQWGLQKIGADYAWNTTVGNHSILAAIIDPVDYNHPDLAPNYVPLGWDWAENDSYPMDTSGHGTHCAGILAAVTNNSIGIAGVAQVKIMAEDWTGNAEIGGWIGGLARSLIHATDAGAKIISCSAGTYYESDLIREAANYATSHGVLVFASAGNYGMNIRWYPAAYDGVEAVASTDINDTVASSSNYGEYMDVAAPGVNIYSTLPNNRYGYMSGTSMACPMAAGVAALIWSQYPNMSAEGIRYQLERTCKDLGDPGIDIHYGYGRVDARNAIETPYPTHELIVKTTSANSGSSMTSPGLQVGQTRQINATVYNCGLSNETNVVLNILIDGTIVHSEVIPNFASGASYKCQYNWTPTAEAVYNVTIAISHLQGETSYANNAVESLIGVSAKIALISDSSSGLGTYLVPLLDAIHVNYDLYQSNYGYYTGNLTFLQNYNAVIFYKDYRNITEAEQTALNSYLASGGNLLVAGGNALSSTVDLRLADVIRSLPSSIKTNQSDLYSASSTHPIMNGPFGVFPAGFRIRNLIGEYSHNSYTDLVYANTSRGARAVATTGDGGAKILATDSLPGKVVFWNGNADNWLIDNCRTIFKNIVAWLTDNAPPATTTDYNGNWYNQDFTINLSATDYFAVNETYYKINNGTTKTLSADGQPKITNESANNTIEYWSIDYSLNQETRHSLSQIKLDKTAPTANAGSTKTVTLGESVTFNGEGSSDANGIVSYKWVLGDGTQANAPKIVHTFTSAGIFSAVLTVQDVAGNSGTETVWVVVNDKPVATVTPTPTQAPTPPPTATPTPTATMTTNPTSTAVPATSSGALPDWVWVAVIAAAVLGIAVGAVAVKRKGLH